MAQKKTNNHSTGQKVAVGVGLTAAAVAAAGAYFLYGSPNAAQNRRKVKSWMLKAKADVLEAMEKAKDMTQDEYDELIDSVAKMYSTVQGASRGDIADFKREMKGHWDRIRKSTAVKKIATHAAKSAAKGAAKEVVKQATKKSPAKKSVKKAAKKSA